LTSCKPVSFSRRALHHGVMLQKIETIGYFRHLTHNAGTTQLSGVPRNFVQGGGGKTLSVEDRGQGERGSGGGSPLVRGSGGSCNLVQEISFHVVKFFLIFGTLRLFMMTTNLFGIANVKQLRTDGSFRILLPFFSEHLVVLAS